MTGLNRIHLVVFAGAGFLAACGNGKIQEPCGNGKIDEGEACDPGDGSPTPCPTSCDDGLSCTQDALVQPGDECTKDCRATFITTCTDNDGCCLSIPCNPSTDNDCTCAFVANCIAGDTCCPAGCGPGNDADCADCSQVSTCTGGDGCCLAQCTICAGAGGEDSDCPSVCDDGCVTGSELCDDGGGSPVTCPTNCPPDANLCTTEGVVGTGCTRACGTTATITTCDGVVDDSCCPPTCNATNDITCAGCASVLTCLDGDLCCPDGCGPGNDDGCLDCSKATANTQGDGCCLVGSTDLTDIDCLTAWYRLDEQPGAVSAANSGTDTSTLSFLGDPLFRSAYYNDGLYFDGVDASASTATAPAWNYSAALSVSAWIYIDDAAAGGANDRVVFMKDGAFTLAVAATTGVVKYAQSFNGGTVIDTLAGGTPLPFRAWVHVAATFDGSTMRVFVNGVQDGTLATTGTSADVGAGQVGVGFSTASPPNFFVGYIDEVRLLPRAYVPFDPKVNYRLNETAGATAADSGEGRSDLTLAGNAAFAPGLLANALSLDGSGDQAVTTTAPMWDFTGGVVLAAWINSTGGAGNRVIVARDGSFSLALDNAGHVVYTQSYNGGAGSQTVTSTSTVAASTWTSVMASFDGAYLRIYLNWLEDAADLANFSVPDNGTGQVSLGDAVGGGSGFTGLIDEVRIVARPTILFPRMWYRGDEAAGASTAADSGSAQASLALTPQLVRWDPIADQPVSALAYYLDGTSGAVKVYAGGSFTSIGGSSRNRIAAINGVTGEAITTWDPNSDGAVRALAVSGTTIYAGGTFTQIGGAARANLVALDAAGVATSWNPGTDGEVRAIAVVGTTIYVGGAFTTAGGAARNNIAAIDATTGVATAWDPNLNGAVNTIVVSGTTAYVGGTFTNVGASARNNIAAIDTATGSATAWNPDINGTVNAIAVSGTTVYAGGAFTSVGGTTRNRLASISTAGVLSAWDPNADGEVLALGVAGTTAYVGGSFGTVGGQARSNVAALSTAAAGAATRWNPGADGIVRALAFNTSNTWHIFMGGAFTTVGGLARNALAASNASTPSTFTPGVFGNALTFDGAGDGATTMNPVSRSTAVGYGVSAWIYQETQGVRTLQTIWAATCLGGDPECPANTAANFKGGALRILANGRVRAAQSFNNALQDVCDSLAAEVVPFNTWTHVGATFENRGDKTLITVYFNGKPSLSPTGVPATDSPCSKGTGANLDTPSVAQTVGWSNFLATRRFFGKIDDLRVYDGPTMGYPHPIP